MAKQNDGYKIIVINLIEESLSRVAWIDFTKGKIQNDVNVEIEYQFLEMPKDNLVVTVSTNIIGKQEVEGNFSEVFTMTTKFSGYFQIIGNPKPEKEIFARSNAPSIIFPFVREHIASVSQKCGIGRIFLQPMNFTISNPEDTTVKK